MATNDVARAVLADTDAAAEADAAEAAEVPPADEAAEEAEDDADIEPVEAEIDEVDDVVDDASEDLWLPFISLFNSFCSSFSRVEFV